MVALGNTTLESAGSCDYLSAKIVRSIVCGHIGQSFTENPELPEMISVDDMMEWFGSLESSYTDNYDNLHERWTYKKVAQNPDDDRA